MGTFCDFAEGSHAKTRQMRNCRKPASKQSPKGNYLRKLLRITKKRWISFAVYKEISVDVYHDRYQIEKICLNAYHCKYEIGEILSESVSLYTLKRQFISDITQCTHTSRIGASSMALYHRTTVNTRKKLRFRWQASQKCTFLLLSGAPEPHMPPSGGRKSGDDNIVNAAKVDSRQHCRNSKLSKEGLLSKQNTICILK